MKRRDFLKTSVIASAALSLNFEGLQAALSTNKDNDYFDMRVNSFYKVELLFTATRVAVILRNKINSCRKAYRF